MTNNKNTQQEDSRKKHNNKDKQVVVIPHDGSQGETPNPEGEQHKKEPFFTFKRVLLLILLLLLALIGLRFFVFLTIFAVGLIINMVTSWRKKNKGEEPRQKIDTPTPAKETPVEPPLEPEEDLWRPKIPKPEGEMGLIIKFCAWVRHIWSITMVRRWTYFFTSVGGISGGCVFCINTDITYLGIFIIILCLIAYIASLIRSKQDRRLVLVSNKFEKILLCYIIPIFTALGFLFYHDAPQFAQITLVIAAILLAISLIMSIVTNFYNPFYILLSFLAKLCIVLAMTLLCAILIIVLILWIILSFIRGFDSDLENEENQRWTIIGYDDSLDAFIGYRRRY